MFPSLISLCVQAVLSKQKVFLSLLVRAKLRCKVVSLRFQWRKKNYQKTLIFFRPPPAAIFLRSGRTHGGRTGRTNDAISPPIKSKAVKPKAGLTRETLTPFSVTIIGKSYSIFYHEPQQPTGGR